jgi:hypothetical protein
MENKKAFGLAADASAPSLMPQENKTVILDETNFGMPKVYGDTYQDVAKQINMGIEKTRKGLKK